MSTPWVVASFCISAFALGTRTGNPACWVRYEGPLGQSVCLPQSEVLSSGPFRSLCGEFSGRWKARENHQSREVQQEFVAVSLPMEAASRWDSARWRVERLRDKLSERIRPADDFGLVRSLFLGEEMPNPPISVLRLWGILHFLHSSGIHLFALWSAILWGSKRLACRFRLSITWMRPLGVGLALSICLSAWFLSGAPGTWLRTSLVLGLGETGSHLGFRWKRPVLALLGFLALVAFGRSVGFSGIGITVLWVLVLSMGESWFWMGSLLGILISCAQVGLVPVLAPLWNTLELTILVPLIYPLFILASLGVAFGQENAGAFLENLAHFVTRALDLMARLELDLPSLWLVPRPTLAAAAFGALVLCSMRIRVRPSAIAAAVLVGLLIRIMLPHAVPLKIEQLDVGQGDAALIRSGSGDFGLIDTGSSRLVSDASWIRTLAVRGVQAIPWVALTHLDEDHSGGLRRLALLYPIQSVEASQGELLSQRGVRYQQALLPEGIVLRDWVAGEIPFPVHAPSSDHGHGNNANMGAVLIPLPGGGFYLSAGDADGMQERP
ncbi:MAG: MBL fold metallo-hydrolase, partial [Bdellovibrionota bacterium]